MDFIARIMAQCHAAAGSAIGGGAGAGTPSTPVSAPASTPASTPGQGGTPAATPSAQGDQRGSGTPPVVDPNASDPAYGNWKQMRENLDAARTRATALETQQASFTKVQTSAQTLATTLGYTAEDFQSAFDADPIGTIAILKQEEAERGVRQTPANGQQTTEQQLAEMVRKATAPVTEQVNRQVTEAAMQKYETNLTETIGLDPVLKNAPPEVHDIVRDYVGEYLSSQPAILLAMKQKGDYSAVKEAVTYVAGRLNTAFTKWLAHSNGQGNATNGQPATPGVRQPGKFNLDDIINDPSVLGSQYK